MDFLSLSLECAPWVAPQTMAAIVKTESGFNSLSIGVNGGKHLIHQPKSKGEAVTTANWLIEKGYSVDLGLGQVNSSNLKKVGLSVDDAFDPCKNVAAAAMLLRANYQTAKGKGKGDQAALHAAISAYNTGSFSKGFSNGYVQKVINNAESVMTAAIFPTSALVTRPAVRQQAQGAGQTVKLNATDDSLNAYGNNFNSVMVY